MNIRSWREVSEDHERCDSKSEIETEWSKNTKRTCAFLRFVDIKTRCTLPKGHEGKHLGSDDSEW